MSFKFNPLPRPFDLSGSGGSYLPLSGGSMTGALDMQDNAIIMTAPDATRWRITIANGGTLTPEQIITGAGTPMGLLLSITNAA